MLIKNWIKEKVSDKYMNFEILCRELLAKAREVSYETSEKVIKVVLERLIEEKQITTYQYLAEDRRYSPTIYDRRNIYWYWFKIKDSSPSSSRNSEILEKLP